MDPCGLIINKMMMMINFKRKLLSA